MAFAIRNLSVLAYANGFTLWNYKTDKDDLSSVEAPNYFENAADMLSRGDIIMICARDKAAVRVAIDVQRDFIKLGTMS